MPRTIAFHISGKCSTLSNRLQHAFVRLWIENADSAYNYKKQDVRKDVYLKTKTFMTILRTADMRHLDAVCSTCKFLYRCQTS